MEVDPGMNACSSDASVVYEPQLSHEAVVHQFCPEAVVYWSKHGLEKKRKSNVDMLVKAKGHLLAMGWSFRHQKKGSGFKLRYISPSGRVYYSLRTACKGFIDGDVAAEGMASADKSSILNAKLERQGSLPSATMRPESFNASDSRKKRKRDDLLHLESQSLQIEANFHAMEDGAAATLDSDGKLRHQAQDKGVKLPEPKGREVKRDDTTMLLSSQIERPEILSSSSNYGPRTALSWLIENNVVLPKAKVHYLGLKGPLAKGQIDRDGIKCDCCNKVFTLTRFEAHAGSKKHRPAANIFLEDGRSLLDCQKQIFGNHKKQHGNINGNGLRSEKDKVEGNGLRNEYDEICSVCQYGGELILCDNCPSSFHKSCLGLKNLPNGDWFCAPCSCGICGKRKFEENSEHSKGDDIICFCDQCEHEFHMGCIRKSRGVVKLKTYSQNKWFCSDRCHHLSSYLRGLLGRPFALGTDSLTWRLLKSTESNQSTSDSHKIEGLMENQNKLSAALDVMHECFEPIKEAFTGRDLFEDVIFNRGSSLKRLNFRGFYTVLLEKNEEVLSVANIRVYEKVAEIPLVATRFQYRKHGMCRFLLNEVERLLGELGVKRLVLPAIPDLLNMWTTKFGFSKMPASEKLQYLDYTFLDFQDATLCQKSLMKTPSAILLSVDFHSH